MREVKECDWEKKDRIDFSKVLNKRRRSLIKMGGEGYLAIKK